MHCPVSDRHLTTTPRAKQNASPRRVHIVLRDGGFLSASVFLAIGQALTPYLSSRKGGWLNVTKAQWEFEGVVHPHAVVRDDDIAWVMPEDDDVPVMPPGYSGQALPVDVLLEDRSCIRGAVIMATGQRLSDYLATGGRFLPVSKARAADTGAWYGDIAINFEHVKAVRHLFALEADPEMAAEKQQEWERARKTLEVKPAPRESGKTPAVGVLVTNRG